MKKKIIGLLICLVAAATLSSGCSQTVLEYEPEPGAGSTTIVEEDPSSSYESEEILVEESEVSEDDPCWIYKTTKATASEHSLYCVLKENDFYLMCDYVFDATEEQLEVEQFPLATIYNPYYADRSDGMVLYRKVESPLVISYVDADALTLEPGDKLVKFDKGMVPILELYPATMIGYTVAVDSSDKEDVPDMVLSDKDGNTIGDWYSLEYGAQYTVSFYRGTQYYEFVYPAICRVYQYSTNKDEIIMLEPILTKEGYAEYDTSTLEPGIYYVESEWCMINIQ